MAQIANRTGNVEDGQNFTAIAHDYVSKWMDLAIAQTSNNFSLPHTTLSYGDNDTYSLLYNLFGDRELGLNLVPQSVYDMQSDFYPTVFNEYGVPLDTRHAYTKGKSHLRQNFDSTLTKASAGDWEMFCASVANTDTKNQFISVVAKWLGTTPTNFAFTDLYDTNTGE